MVRSLVVLAVFVTAAAAQVPADKALATMKAGDGLQVELFAAEPILVNPTNMDIDPLGRVWITEAVNYRTQMRKKPLNREEGDRIVVLTDKDGDGKADASTVFYQGKELYGPLGICIIPQLNDKKLGYRVLVSQSPDILEFWDKDGDLKADGPPTKFLSGFLGFDHDHGVHSIQVGPDGKFYLTVGDQGFKDLKSSDGKQNFSQNRTTMQAGTVWRCDPDGKNLEMLAHNFRNPYEACVDSFGEIWLSDNDDDGNQQTRICHVMPGGNYGYWPRGKGESHWHEEQPGIVPKTLRTGFGSPCGITCYEGTLLPEKFRGQLIHADAGPREIRCFHKKPKGAGYELDKTLMLTSTDNWFRPSDVCVAPDGSVFVCDWYDPGVGGHGMGDTTRGRIYRITPAGHKGYKIPTHSLSNEARIVASFDTPCLSSRLLLSEQINKLAANDALILLATGMNGSAHKSTAIRCYLQLGTKGQQIKAEDRPKAVTTTFLQFMVAAGKEPGLAEHMHRVSVNIFGPISKSHLDIPVGNEEKDLAKYLSTSRGNVVLTYRDEKTEYVIRRIYFAMKYYDGQDRFYLAALNIACGTDPARRDAILADFEKHFPVWDDKVAELVFELRPKVMMPKLDGLLHDAKLTDKQKGRIVDILATSPDAAAGKSMLAILAADQPAEVQAKALDNLRLFLPTKWAALAKSKDLDDAITKLFSNEATLRTGLQLIAAANATARVKDVMKATGKDLPPKYRTVAIETLGQLKDVAAAEALITLALPENDDSARCIAAVANHLGATYPNALDFLKATMTNADASVAMKSAAVAALAGNRIGTDYLLNLREQKKLPAELVEEAGKLLRNSPFQGSRNKALILFPAATKLDLKKLPTPAELAKRSGDAKAGRAVFLASFKGEAQCMKCHTVHKEGGAIGPELSAIGKKASREDLFTSILQPSKAIADQFVTWKVETADGATATGLLVKESPTEITIRDANGKDYIIAVKSIEKKTKTPTSLMADDTAKSLTEKELVDLVEYLFSLKE